MGGLAALSLIPIGREAKRRGTLARAIKPVGKGLRKAATGLARDHLARSGACLRLPMH